MTTVCSSWHLGSCGVTAHMHALHTEFPFTVTLIQRGKLEISHSLLEVQLFFKPSQPSLVFIFLSFLHSAVLVSFCIFPFYFHRIPRGTSAFILQTLPAQPGIHFPLFLTFCGACFILHISILLPQDPAWDKFVYSSNPPSPAWYSFSSFSYILRCLLHSAYFHFTSTGSRVGQVRLFFKPSQPSLVFIFLFFLHSAELVSFCIFPFYFHRIPRGTSAFILQTLPAQPGIHFPLFLTFCGACFILHISILLPQDPAWDKFVYSSNPPSPAWYSFSSVSYILRCLFHSAYFHFTSTGSRVGQVRLFFKPSQPSLVFIFLCFLHSAVLVSFCIFPFYFHRIPRGTSAFILQTLPAQPGIHFPLFLTFCGACFILHISILLPQDPAWDKFVYSSNPPSPAWYSFSSVSYILRCLFHSAYFHFTSTGSRVGQVRLFFKPSQPSLVFIFLCFLHSAVLVSFCIFPFYFHRIPRGTSSFILQTLPAQPGIHFPLFLTFCGACFILHISILLPQDPAWDKFVYSSNPPSPAWYSFSSVSYILRCLFHSAYFHFTSTGSRVGQVRLFFKPSQPSLVFILLCFLHSAVLVSFCIFPFYFHRIPRGTSSFILQTLPAQPGIHFPLFLTFCGACFILHISILLQQDPAWDKFVYSSNPPSPAWYSFSSVSYILRCLFHSAYFHFTSTGSSVGQVRWTVAENYFPVQSPTLKGEILLIAGLT